MVLDGLTMSATPSMPMVVITRFGYFFSSSDLTSRDDIPISAVFSPAAWTPTLEPPPVTWISVLGWVPIYASAVSWAMGRTVVEPVTLIDVRSCEEDEVGSFPTHPVA